MPPLPKEKCPYCERQAAMRVGGQLREHNGRDGKCPASGKTLEQARELVRKELDVEAALEAEAHQREVM